MTKQALSFLILATLLSPASCGERSTQPPLPAIAAILETFDHYPVILLGEDHWLRRAGEFYISLVTNPRFSIATRTGRMSPSP